MLHGNNLSTLHDALPLDILPAELGGEGPSYNSERWLKEFCQYENLVSSPVPTITAAAATDNELPAAKLDKAYIHKDNQNFSFHSNEKSAKSELLRDKD